MSNNSDYLYIWDGIFAKILSRGYKFTASEKENFSFPYDTLYCEPEVNSFFRVLDGKQRILKENEIAEIKEMCDKFIVTQDYPVQAYNPDDFIFIGTMMKSEAIKRGYDFRLTEIPEFPVSRWNDSKLKWDNIQYIILENGQVLKHPEKICDQCLLFFTEEEFNELEKRPNEYYIWDFKTDSWIDPRDTDKLKENAILQIRNYFESIRWKEYGRYIPQYEQFTWDIQIREATDWLADNSKLTPYIDSFLALRTDKNKPTKQELCEDILQNNIKFINVMAKVNAEQWNQIKIIENLKNNLEIDSFLKTFFESNLYY